MSSDSRNRTRSAELVLLILASYVKDHNGGRSMVVVIACEILIRGNIQFGQVVKVVYCMPDRAAAG